jgi:hypothetical protein
MPGNFRHRIHAIPPRKRWAFDAKNVFTSASGTFEDPHVTGFDHVKATAGFPFGKNNLSPRETASKGPLCQEGKFSFC